jgi:hypothetical protein
MPRQTLFTPSFVLLEHVIPWAFIAAALCALAGSVWTLHLILRASIPASA